MEITIKIECDNEAFAHGMLREVKRIVNCIRELPEDRVKLRDINGNTVGYIEVSS